MIEIEKLYENAGIKKKRMCEWTCRGNEFCSTNCEHYESTKEFYPPFTTEKQIELIKWLAYKFSFFAIEYNFQEWSISNGLISGYYKKSLEESISGYINSLWQSLTDQEKEEIRNILNAR